MAKLGPLPDVPGVCKIRLLGKTQANTNWANVLHAKATGTLSTATLVLVAGQILTYWLSDLAPYIGTPVTLTTVEITDISSRTGNQGTSASGGAGSGGATVLPANVAACLSLKIANRYRGGHPRMYLPGVLQAATTNGATMPAGYASNYTSAGRAFLNHVNAIVTGTTTWQLAAVSYYHKVGGAEAYKTPPDVYPITDIICHTRLDSQRRRLGKEV